MSKKDEVTSLQQLNQVLELVKTWSEISAYQKKITKNYQNMLWGAESFEELISLCPKYLQQTINPWSFSLISLTKEMKGSPNQESKIVQEVASYGSQLGTVIDFLKLLAQEGKVNAKALADEPEKLAILCKFESLVDQIERCKK
ncbi:hypothetical protein [Vibrio quintilis]|uniref:Uncharacterized protein n=1 Tax=Vibrio quintilis TaxID=1117707 RepID=A0A1M7YNX7_9VIBR|nr:hypothetical protein [Vibrio quintilis]SHO54352.1 hypothetical protein VQ7734_00066 [Vibrio quintilis]